MLALYKIQQELKVPKNQRNTFGNYNFRSLEDILEAVKPILSNGGLVLILSDNIENIGTKNYVKATASLYNNKDGKLIASNTAYAREAEAQKGMNDSQLTGSTSSYARKYACNGLFGIDDTKDSDFTNEHGKGEKKSVPKQTPKKEAPNLTKQAAACKTMDELAKWFGKLSSADKTKANGVKNNRKEELSTNQESDTLQLDSMINDIKNQDEAKTVMELMETNRNEINNYAETAKLYNEKIAELGLGEGFTIVPF